MKNKDIKDTRMLSVGILDVVFIVLLILKLFGLIEINWLWMFFPLYAPFGLALLILIIAKLLK